MRFGKRPKIGDNDSRLRCPVDLACGKCGRLARIWSVRKHDFTDKLTYCQQHADALRGKGFEVTAVDRRKKAA